MEATSNGTSFGDEEEHRKLASATDSAVNGVGDMTPGRIGPHPGFISSSNQYSAEIKLRRMLKDNGCDPAREENYRLQGVQLIDNVREHLQLPVRTFDTASTYFHKFRLNFRDSEYNYQDAALASLFVACKVEDTIKKSREILAAAYNTKNPDKPVAPDDKIFESPGKIIIGLERLILETIGFDFRTRYPQKLLVKVVRSILGRSAASSRAFFATAYAMCIDMYKTFVPIKRTTLSMVMAVVELTARVRAEHLERVQRFAGRRRQLRQYSRDAVMESMLDLLDLYVQHHKVTRLGALFDLGTFIDIKIRLNTDLDDTASPRYRFHCSRCEVSDANPLTPIGPGPGPGNGSSSAGGAVGTSPVCTTTTVWPPDAAIRRTARAQNGTMRFVFDPEAADKEQARACEFFKHEYEEYEVEVDESESPVPYEREGGRGAGGGGGTGGGDAGGGGGYWGGYRERGDHRRGGSGLYAGYRGEGRPYRGRGRYH